jgi:ribonuclease BN (tRNA processing enzyme)
MKLVPLAVDESLSLRNDGTLEVFFLGVGSMFAQRHYQLNIILVKGDQHLLVDFGMTGPASMHNVARLNPAFIHAVLPTHSHDDHIGGLGYLALTSKYIGQPFMKQPKLKLITTGEYRDILWDRSLRGSLEHNERKEDGSGLVMTDFFDIVLAEPKDTGDRPTWIIQLGDMKIELFRTRHIPEQATTIAESFISYGLFVDDRVFLSGDTQFDPELIQNYAARGAEVFFHDVQFFPGAVHAPLTDLRTLPEAIKQRMFLNHLADSWEEQDPGGFAGWAQQGITYRFD